MSTKGASKAATIGRNQYGHCSRFAGGSDRSGPEDSSDDDEVELPFAEMDMRRKMDGLQVDRCETQSHILRPSNQTRNRGSPKHRSPKHGSPKHGSPKYEGPYPEYESPKHGSPKPGSPRTGKKSFLQSLIDGPSSCRVVSQPSIQLDEILSENAVQARTISQDVINRSIVTFKAGIDKLSDDAMVKFQAHNHETACVMAEAGSLLRAHLTRNDRNAEAVLFAIAEMSKWKASEDKRVKLVVASQTTVALKKNAIHSGSEVTGNNRLLHYRCIGEHVRRVVVSEEESPRCSIVFPGKHLAQSPNRFSTSISKFSDLTLGLCPNCLQFYRIDEVNLSKLIESAKDTISNRLRHDQWSEPVIRPHDGSRPIKFSEQLEKKLRKKEAAGAKVIVTLIEELQAKLENFKSLPDIEKPMLVQITYKDMIGKINSQLECSDCMNIKQWDTLRTIQAEITDLLERHKDPKSKHRRNLDVALTQLRIKKGRIPTTAPVSPRRDKFSNSPERSLPDSVLRRKR